MFFKYVFLFCFSLSALYAASKDSLGWMHDGQEIIDQARRVKARLDQDKKLRFSHNPELLERFESEFHSVVVPHFTDQAIDYQDVLEALTVFKEAQLFTLDVGNAFYMWVAKKLNPHISPVLNDFQETSMVLDAVRQVEECKTPEQAQTISTFMADKLKDQEVLPYFTFSATSGVFGLKTLVDSLVLYDIAPVVISLGAPHVHGHLVEGALSFALHDYLHALLYNGAVHRTSLKADLLRIRAFVQDLGSDHKAQMHTMQLHLWLHEATVTLRDTHDLEGMKDRITLDMLREEAQRVVQEAAGTEEAYRTSLIERYKAEFVKSVLHHMEKGGNFPPVEERDIVPAISFEEKDNRVTVRLEASFTDKEGGKSLHQSRHSLSSLEMLRRNVSDYAWHFKKLGLIPSDRNLRRTPLTPEELYATFMQVSQFENPLIK